VPNADELALWLIASLRIGSDRDGSADACCLKNTGTVPSVRNPLRPAVTLPARVLRVWWRHRIERRELAALSDRELRDIGLNRYELAHAIRKPFRKECQGRCWPEIEHTF
jgi:uncharacterized protein YjiS (DUF1127 family)